MSSAGWQLRPVNTERNCPWFPSSSSCSLFALGLHRKCADFLRVSCIRFGMFRSIPVAKKIKIFIHFESSLYLNTCFCQVNIPTLLLPFPSTSKPSGRGKCKKVEDCITKITSLSLGIRHFNPLLTSTFFLA